MNPPFVAVLIVDIIFIFLALGLNKDDSKYLLSGYNTMSKMKRENFDIEKYLKLFINFFLALAVSSTVVFTIFINLTNEKIAVVGYSIYLMIMLIWFVIQGNKFKKI